MALFVASLVLTCVANPWSIFISVPMISIMVVIRNYGVKTQQPLWRMEALRKLWTYTPGMSIKTVLLNYELQGPVFSVFKNGKFQFVKWTILFTVVL